MGCFASTDLVITVSMQTVNLSFDCDWDLASDLESEVELVSVFKAIFLRASIRERDTTTAPTVTIETQVMMVFRMDN